MAKDILLGKHTSGKKTRRQYHLLSLYDTMEVGHKQLVIKKRLEDNDDVIYITPYEDLFEILYSTHIAVGHGSRDKMIFGLKSKIRSSQINRLASLNFKLPDQCLLNENVKLIPLKNP